MYADLHFKVSRAAIDAARKRHTQVPNKKNKKVSKYASLDWSKTDAELSRQMSVTRRAINDARKRHAPLAFRNSPRIFISKYASVDWSKTNVELAQELSVSKKAIETARWKYTRTNGK